MDVYGVGGGQDVSGVSGEERGVDVVADGVPNVHQCEGDSQACDYDNVTYSHSPEVGMMEILTTKYDDPAQCIGVWLKEIESCGFRCFSIDEEVLEENDNDVKDDNDPDEFVVEDPFVEINEEDVEKYEREDGLDITAGLKGHCSAFLKNGFEVNGQWRKGRREGPGLISGHALEARGIKAIWGRYKKGYLTGPAKVSLLDGDCTLEGHFVNGKLQGPVRGLTSRGRLAWAGFFKNGKPFGPSWRGLEGGVFLYGNVGPRGLFSGSKNAFIYPDLKTSLLGKFHEGKMVEAVPVDIKKARLDKTGAILKLRFSKPSFRSPVFKYWPSGLDFVAVPPLQDDPYEQKFVFADKSMLSDFAGDGLFLKKDVPANTTIAFYNGIRVRPKDTPPFMSSGYQIFVDSNKRFEVTSDYMDIPPEYVSLENYRASLGHKINHSFDPNCRWGTTVHPTFGRVPRVVTMKSLKAGTELTCHYMIDMEEAAADLDYFKWYVDLWDEFSKGKRQEMEMMDISEDETMSNSSSS